MGDYGTVNADPTDNTLLGNRILRQRSRLYGNFQFRPHEHTRGGNAACSGVRGGAIGRHERQPAMERRARRTSYQIERSSDGVTYTTVASGLTGTTFTDTPGGNVSGLYYEIMAFNGQTDSAAPSPIQVTLAAATATTPLRSDWLGRKPGCDGHRRRTHMEQRQQRQRLLCLAVNQRHRLDADRHDHFRRHDHLFRFRPGGRTALLLSRQHTRLRRASSRRHPQ